MDLKIAIVDDLAEDRAQLEQDLQTWFSTSSADMVSGFSVETFSGGPNFLKDYSPGDVQVAFLDICMDEMDGISLARQLRALDTRILIIFLTASREFAFDAFPVHPFDYLVKPYDPVLLGRVMEEALRVLSAARPEMVVKVPRGEVHIPYDGLVTALSQGHAVDIITSDGQRIRSIQTFAVIWERLRGDPRFLLCNRGVLVNMDFVAALDGDSLRLRDGQSVLLRVRGRSDIIDQFTRYQFQRMKRGTGK